MTTTWIVRRARFYGSGSGYQVRIGTEQPQPPPKSFDALLALKSTLTDDDGKQVELGTEPWPQDVDCPDCGAVIVWAEAGFVPGHRICPRCGGHWEVTTSTTVPSITTAGGYEVTDPKSPLLTADEAGRLVARQGRTLDAGASREMVQGYHAELATMEGGAQS